MMNDHNPRWDTREIPQLDLPAGTKLPVQMEIVVMDSDTMSAHDIVGTADVTITGTGVHNLSLAPSGTISLSVNVSDGGAAPDGSNSGSDASGGSSSSDQTDADRRRKAQEAREQAARDRARREEEARVQLEEQRKRREEAERKAQEAEQERLRQQADREKQQTENRPVTRENLNKMSYAAQQRFVKALRKMMENKNGKDGTSEFARLAGYHGYPYSYCAHGEETFPAWHRAYMCEFEQFLQQADQALGNDGKIGLPYWDFVDEMNSSNGPMIPTIIAKEFKELPQGLLENVAEGSAFIRRGYELRTESEMRRRMRNARVGRKVDHCLMQKDHWQHASTRNTKMYSLEDPHNDVHNCVGYPMNTKYFAAYHPIFWLHHCNIDRIYEGFLTTYGIGASKRDMQERQTTLSEFGETNRYNLHCAPFKHPKTGQDFFPEHAFEIDKLGFRYDTVPTGKRTGQQMQEMPTFAVFMNLRPRDFAHHSYSLHLFLVPNAEAESFVVPATVEEYDKLSTYAGEGNIFGGKGDECVNCIDRKPFHVAMEVTDTLRDLSCERHDVTMIVVKERDDSQPLTEEENAFFTAPIMKGPFFDNNARNLEKAADQKQDGEVLALQQRLRSVAVTYATCCDLGPVLCIKPHGAVCTRRADADVCMCFVFVVPIFPASGNLGSSRAHLTAGLETGHKPQSRNTKNASV